MRTRVDRQVGELRSGDLPEVQVAVLEPRAEGSAVGVNPRYDPENVKRVILILQCDRCGLAVQYNGYGRTRWHCPRCVHVLKLQRKVITP